MLVLLLLLIFSSNVYSQEIKNPDLTKLRDLTALRHQQNLFEQAVREGRVEASAKYAIYSWEEALIWNNAASTLINSKTPLELSKDRETLLIAKKYTINALNVCVSAHVSGKGLVKINKCAKIAQKNLKFIKKCLGEKKVRK